MSGDPWFVRRRFGYGWQPAAWPGWLITVIAIGGVIAAVVYARMARTFVGVIIALAILAVLFVIATLTGQRREQQ